MNDATQPGAVPPQALGSGFAAFWLLAPGIPIASALAACPWSPFGLDTFLLGLLPGGFAGFALGLPLAFGMKRRSRWWRRWFRWGGYALLIAYAAALVAAAAYPIGAVGLREGAEPGLGALGWFGFILLLALGIAAAMLGHALRDRGWRD